MAVKERKKLISFAMVLAYVVAGFRVLRYFLLELYVIQAVLMISAFAVYAFRYDPNFTLKQPAENVVLVEFGRLEQNDGELPVFHTARTLKNDKLPAFLEEAEAVQYNFTLLGSHSIYDCKLNETVVKITFADGAYHYLHPGGSAYVSAEGEFREREEATWYNGYDDLVKKYKYDLPPNSSYQQEE